MQQIASAMYEGEEHLNSRANIDYHQLENKQVTIKKSKSRFSPTHVDYPALLGCLQAT